MCDPVTIGAATLALSATQSVMTYIGTNQAYAANKEAANIDYAREQDALGRQQTQLQQENSEAAFDTALATLKAEGGVAASASSRGLAQSSVIRAVNSEMFGIGRQRTAEQQNFRARNVELANSRTDAAVRRQSRINSAPRSSILQLGVNLAGDALSGAGAYNNAKRA